MKLHDEDNNRKSKHRIQIECSISEANNYVRLNNPYKGMDKSTPATYVSTVF